VDTHGVTNDNMATPTTIEMRGVETIMSSPGKRGRINHGNKTKLTQVTLQHSSCWGKTTELCLIGGSSKLNQQPVRKLALLLAEIALNVVKHPTMPWELWELLDRFAKD